MTIQTTNWNRDRSVLESEFGIYMPAVLGYKDEARASDAAFTPVTAANNAIPSQFTTYIDPQIIDVLTAPLKAAQIYGEARKGDWVHDTMMFVIIEDGGQVAQYGDYNNAGYSSSNTNFPQRQQFVMQIFSQIGDREAARAALANVDLPSRKKKAAIVTLNQWQNFSYFWGVQNLENYGALNDPHLPTPISPNVKAYGGSGWEKATAVEIYEDIQELYRQLQKQNNGIVNLDNAVDMDSPLKLVVSNDVQAYLLKTNEYGISVLDLLKKNFPNLVQMSAPQLSLESGELVQLFVEGYQGIDTFTCAFSEKLRSHGIFRESSSIKEKLTQGSWGTILVRPTLVSQMLGV